MVIDFGLLFSSALQSFDGVAGSDLVEGPVVTAVKAPQFPTEGLSKLEEKHDLGRGMGFSDQNRFLACGIPVSGAEIYRSHSGIGTEIQSPDVSVNRPCICILGWVHLVERQDDNKGAGKN